MKKVLLSFDIEEFDFPRERGEEISLARGVKISKTGTLRLLKLLKSENVKATFFVTGNFAQAAPEVVKKMIQDGHEVAAHGVDHFAPQPSDPKNAKKILKKITKTDILGWRQPRMQKIDYHELSRLGYRYDSSTNPAFIPGRYNNLKLPRTPFQVKNTKILEIPTSVATIFRVPLFWLALHLFPLPLYKILAKMSLKKTGLFVTYFHPWEFTNLKSFKIVPWYIKHNSGQKLESRLLKLIKSLKDSDAEFVTFRELLTRGQH